MIVIVGLIVILMAAWGLSTLASGLNSAADSLNAVREPKTSVAHVNTDGSSKALEQTLYWLIGILCFGGLLWMFLF
jgi:hypothetical protein